ncbi:MAG: cytochrome C [Deltaproteobacteria bacterium]|nr:cytochrome C [Deltaproteobacteria bacterium]
MSRVVVVVVVVVLLGMLAGSSSSSSPPASHPAGLRCDACHTPAGWRPAKFVHERTGFPLVGQHVGVTCTACHTRDWSDPVPQSCAGCHQDPHAQEFGLQCRACHDERAWQPLFVVDAHRRTQFPLSGRHASLPCEQCHVEKRERTFTRAALSCTACHARDAQRATTTTLDHRRLSSQCQQCHVPVSFTPARFVEHDACFPLAGTVHAAVRCSECHDARTLPGSRVSGACAGVPVRCADCHVHRASVSDREHRGVPGYAHQSEKCAACHRSTR